MREDELLEEIRQQGEATRAMIEEVFVILAQWHGVEDPALRDAYVGRLHRKANAKITKTIHVKTRQRK